jgi:hypothetical protein
LLATLAVLAPSVFAAGNAKTSPTVQGNWEMTVKGPAAHGDMTATLQLKQDGVKVTGAFGMHGQSHALAGEFAEGTLSLETTDTPDDKSLSFTAELKEDGTLAGHVSTSMGDMRWTAARAKGNK